jgi:NADH-quinone oxidoreductase subunit B
MGVCASSGGMFNNYASYRASITWCRRHLPAGCRRAEMLLRDPQLHAKIQEMPLGVNREEAIREAERRRCRSRRRSSSEGLLLQ